MDIYSKLHSEMASRQKEMENDINSYVAMYNIKDRKAFFFMTNEEARHAINFISDKRKNIKSDLFMTEHKLASLIAKSINEDGEVCFDKVKRITVNVSRQESSSITMNLVNFLFAKVEECEKIVTSLFMNATTFSGIRNYGKQYWSESPLEDVYDYGIYGTIYTANIRVVKNIKDNIILAGSLANKNKEDNELFEFHLVSLK